MFASLGLLVVLGITAFLEVSSMVELEQKQDREMLKELFLEKLLDVFFLHIRNLWRVDGLYFLGIEEKFGTEAATEIDANCWSVLAKIEARDLKKTLGVERVEDAETLLYLLRNTSWALYQTKKAVEIDSSKNIGVFRVVSCKVQEARLRKGLEIFPCKKVRFGYLKSFAEELNPNFKVTCRVCPPDKKPLDYWCEWEFKLKTNKEKNKPRL
jgi:hypothetical protein